MKVKLTPSYIGAALLVIIILIATMFRIGSWLGWWGVVDVYGMIMTFIINWVIVITFAILGGILFGLFVGFRLSTQGFTPFEKSMLTMFTRVEDIQERLKRIEEELGRSSTRTLTGDSDEEPETTPVIKEGGKKEEAEAALGMDEGGDVEETQAALGMEVREK